MTFFSCLVIVKCLAELLWNYSTPSLPTQSTLQTWELFWYSSVVSFIKFLLSSGIAFFFHPCFSDSSFRRETGEIFIFFKLFATLCVPYTDFKQYFFYLLLLLLSILSSWLFLQWNISVCVYQVQQNCSVLPCCHYAVGFICLFCHGVTSSYCSPPNKSSHQISPAIFCYILPDKFLSRWLAESLTPVW